MLRRDAASKCDCDTFSRRERAVKAAEFRLHFRGRIGALPLLLRARGSVYWPSGSGRLRHHGHTVTRHHAAAAATRSCARAQRMRNKQHGMAVQLQRDALGCGEERACSWAGAGRPARRAARRPTHPTPPHARGAAARAHAEEGQYLIVSGGDGRADAGVVGPYAALQAPPAPSYAAVWKCKSLCL